MAIDIDNLPNNSRRAKSEGEIEKNMNPPKDDSRKVTNGGVKSKQNSKGKSLINSILVDDLHNIKDYLIYDVMIPSFRNLLYDSVENAASMLFLNGEKPSSRRGSSGRSRRDERDKPSYYKYYDDRDERNSRRGVRGGRSFDYDILLFDRRSDAEKVLDKMFETLDKYKMVSVADMFEFAGADRDIKYTYNDYGWTKLDDDTAYVERNHDGDFFITLPRVKPLDKN